MVTFHLWLLFRETLDSAAYNELFRQEVEKLLPTLTDPVQRRRLRAMKNFDWTNYIGAAVRNAGFRGQDEIQETIHAIVVKLLVSPGGLFRKYDEQRHGPMDLRFKRAVANSIKNIVEKQKNRRRLIPTVPIRREFVPGGVMADDLPSRYEPGDDALIEHFRELLQQRLGDLAVAVFDQRLEGKETKELIGRPEIGSPGRQKIKTVVQKIKKLAWDFALKSDNPTFFMNVERAMAEEAATVERRKATTRRRAGIGK